MEKETIVVPKGIRYIDQWDSFSLPNHPCIINKTITGCGFTEYCLTSPDNVILCSPRKVLLENKEEQHKGEVFYARSGLEKSTNFEKDLTATKKSKEQEKLDALKQFAFNASQNGDPMMAVAAIEGDNVASISKLIKKFQEQKEAHEMQLQQMEQQTKQMEQEFELQKIQVKGEEDRKTKELEGYIDQQIELIRADSNMISYNAEVSDEAKEEGLDRLQDARNQLDREKLQLERQKMMLDTYNKQQDRAVKLKDIDTKYKIAKTNKNKYDKK